MIGTIDRQQRDVTVVGAGIAGLLAAHRLDQQGYEVTLLESQAHAGGLISTAQTPFGLAESAAHSFLVTAPVRKLCAELEVPLVSVNRGSRARYVLRNGRARRFPLTLGEAAGAFRRALFTPAVAGDETMDEWALRHLGPAARDYLIGPFLLGIHAALPAEIGVEVAFPKLKPLPGKSLIGSMLRRQGRGQARPKMMTPAQGMGALVTALERSLDRRLGTRFRRGTPVASLPEAGNVVLAVPAQAAAQLLHGQDSELASRLREVEYTSMVSVTVFVSRADLDLPIEGVGLLIPSRENRRILGVLFNSSAFAGRVSDERVVSFTVMLGGSLHADSVKLSDSELEKVVCEELDAVVGLNSGPLHLRIHRWQRALPRYCPRLAQTWQVARQGWCASPGHTLFGNYTGQLSVRGMIESAATLG